MKKHIISSAICAALLSLSCIAPAMAGTYSVYEDMRADHMAFLNDNETHTFGTVEDVAATMEEGFEDGWRFTVDSVSSGETCITLINGTKSLGVVVPVDENGCTIDYDDRGAIQVQSLIIGVSYDGSSTADVCEVGKGLIQSFSSNADDDIANSAINYELVISWFLNEIIENQTGDFCCGDAMNAYGTGIMAVSSATEDTGFMFFLVSR